MMQLEEENLLYRRLEEKRRLLRQKLAEEENEIAAKQMKAGRLKKELLDLNPGYKPELPGQTMDRLYRFMKDVCTVTSRILAEEAYIPSRYITQTSSQYYKVEKEVFERYIRDYSDIPVNDFIETCAKFSFIRTENCRYVFTSGRLRIYMVSKSIMDEVKKYS